MESHDTKGSHPVTGQGQARVREGGAGWGGGPGHIQNASTRKAVISPLFQGANERRLNGETLGVGGGVTALTGRLCSGKVELSGST